MLQHMHAGHHDTHTSTHCISQRTGSYQCDQCVRSQCALRHERAHTHTWHTTSPYAACSPVLHCCNIVTTRRPRRHVALAPPTNRSQTRPHAHLTQPCTHLHAKMTITHTDFSGADGAPRNEMRLPGAGSRTRAKCAKYANANCRDASNDIVRPVRARAVSHRSEAACSDQHDPTKAKQRPTMYRQASHMHVVSRARPVRTTRVCACREIDRSQHITRERTCVASKSVHR
jgi:hypothetical protein